MNNGDDMDFVCYYCEKEFDEPDRLEVQFTIPEAFNLITKDGKKYIGICPFCKSSKILRN